MAEEYACTLTKESEEKARKELNEIPSDRLAAVQAFRKWIKDQKHITCPTDARFLLAFLRARKFSQLEARKLLETFLTRRKALAYMFQDLDPSHPEFQSFLDKGFLLKLPGTDKEGRTILLLRPGILNPSDVKKNKVQLFRAFATFLDYVYMDENTQVNGTISFVDQTGFSMALHNALPLSDRKDFFGVWQKGYPARIKGFHVYNMGTLLDFLMGIIKVIMTEKIQKRLKSHSDLETIYKVVPMEMLPDEYLPDDYDGPIAGSFEELSKKMKEDMVRPEVVAWIKKVSSSQNFVDESKKPTDVPVASFRKLNVD